MNKTDKRISEIRERAVAWRDRPAYDGSMADAFDRIAAWTQSSERDIWFLLREVERLQKRVAMYEVVKS